MHMYMYVIAAYGHGGVCAHVYVCHGCLWSWGCVCTCICMSWLLMVIGVCNVCVVECMYTGCLWQSFLIVLAKQIIMVVQAL